MKKHKQVALVGMGPAVAAGPSGSENASLLTPVYQFVGTGQRNTLQQTHTLTPEYAPNRQDRLYVSVHRPSTPQQHSHRDFRRHFRSCNNKFHPCHHNRRLHTRKSQRDHGNIAFDLLKPLETQPAGPITSKSVSKEPLTGKHTQHTRPKGQIIGTDGRKRVNPRVTWPTGCHGDVDAKNQSPFISRNSFKMADKGNKEYIPIKIEDYLPPRSDGGVISTTTCQLTMLTALKDRANCLGGWSFLVLALGAVVFLPATLFTGLYLKHTANPLRIIGLSFFSLSILLISIGIGICVVWMRFSSDNRSRPGSPIKAPFQKDIAKEALHTTEPSVEEYELGMANATRKEEGAVYPSTSKEEGWSEEQSETLPLSVV